MPDTLPASEMLPPDRPLWDDPDATVMPDVARPTVSQFFTEIAANFRSLECSGPPLQEIDKAAGY